MEGERLPSQLRHSSYWLRRCRGFRVEAANRYVGRVEEPRYHSRADRPDALAVRAGRFGGRLIVIPVDEIADISPGEQRIALRSAPPVEGRLRLLRAARLRLLPTTWPGSGAEVAKRLRRADSSALDSARPERRGDLIPESGARLLVDARALVVQGWCRSEPAVDADHAAVDPASAAAIRWSAAGALVAAQARRRDGAEPAALVDCAFAQADLALRAVIGDIVPWNAAPERSHDEVLAAFDRAIELLRPSGQPRAVAERAAPCDPSSMRKEVRREMSAEAEQEAEATEEAAEAPATPETVETPAAEETEEGPSAEESAEEST